MSRPGTGSGCAWRSKRFGFRHSSSRSRDWAPSAEPHPTVVWAGVGHGHPHLFALHKRIQDAVLNAGIEPDLTPFHPHITIARTKGVSREALIPFLRRHAEEELGMWKVTGFTLFSSVLSPGGATYSIELRREF